MKVLTFLALLFPTILHAGDTVYIYDKAFGGRRIGRVENTVIYDRSYAGKKIGRIEKDGTIFDKAYGGRKVGRIESKEGKDISDDVGAGAYRLLKERR